MNNLIIFNDQSSLSPSEINLKLENLLIYVEQNLVNWLNTPNEWQSKYIDYEKPYVERIYKPILYNNETYYISLHKIDYKQTIDECLFHTHDYPLLIKILEGEYIMITSNNNDINNVIKFKLNKNSIYIMNSPEQYHAVCPIDNYSYSIMITYKPFKGDKKNNPNKKLLPLNEDNKINLINKIKSFY